MYNHLLYLLYWLINSLLFYLASFAFAGNVILGNTRFNEIESAVYAGFWVTFIIWVVWDYIYARAQKLGDTFITSIIFWITNSVGIWLVSRFSDVLGLGISNYGWAFVVGVFANFIQRLAMRALLESRSKGNT